MIPSVVAHTKDLGTTGISSLSHYQEFIRQDVRKKGVSWLKFSLKPVAL